MKDNESVGGLKGLAKQFLYTESENTNTDRFEVIEYDKDGKKHIINKAGAGPEIKNKINNHYQSEGVKTKHK